MHKPRIAFIGLGVMGSPMAGHLASRGGYPITAFNRTRSKADAWRERHAGQGLDVRIADTPAAAVEGADFVFSCVGDDPDLREVTLGKHGTFAAMRAGAVFVDHTTASADIARELSAAAKERGFEFLDAPVSGGQAGAENGSLTVMVGGNRSAFEAAQPLIMHFARAVTLLGPSGSGQLTKMVNQICIAGLLQALSEGIHFGRSAGLDMNLVLDVISKGAAQSWQMENRGRTMLADKFDFGFAVDWMRKDLRICQAEAVRNRVDLPVTRTIAGYYDEISRLGGGRWDTSSLIRRLQSPAEEP
jgi:3-hydroxyisobutyrate dehydrogenase